MATSTVVTYPIVAAIVASERFLGRDREWTPTNELQQRFLAEFFAPCRNEIGGIPEIESTASRSAGDIASFLRERGFSILPGPLGHDEFGVASVLDLLVKWLHEGIVTQVVTPDNRAFPGVRIAGDGVSFYRGGRHTSDIACLHTQSGDAVFLTMIEQPPTGFDLVALAQELESDPKPSSDYAGVQFPMVNLDHSVDISWLVGLRTTASDGSPMLIAQALQQTKLKVNEKGARVESAVMLPVAAAWPPPKEKPDLVINRPFLMWISRERLSRPLFVGFIEEDVWQNPGDLTA